MDDLGLHKDLVCAHNEISSTVREVNRALELFTKDIQQAVHALDAVIIHAKFAIQRLGHKPN